MDNRGSGGVQGGVPQGREWGRTEEVRSGGTRQSMQSQGDRAGVGVLLARARYPGGTSRGSHRRWEGQAGSQLSHVLGGRRHRVCPRTLGKRRGGRTPRPCRAPGWAWALHRGMDSGPSQLVGGIWEVLSRQRVQGRCQQNPRPRDSEEAPVSPPARTGTQLWGKKPFSLLP